MLKEAGLVALEGRDNVGRGGASGRKESFGAGRGGAQQEGRGLLEPGPGWGRGLEGGA